MATRPDHHQRPNAFAQTCLLTLSCSLQSSADHTFSLMKVRRSADLGSDRRNSHTYYKQVAASGCGGLSCRATGYQQTGTRQHEYSCSETRADHLINSLVHGSSDGFIHFVLCLCVLKLRLKKQCLSFRFLCNRRVSLRSQICALLQTLR